RAPVPEDFESAGRASRDGHGFVDLAQWRVAALHPHFVPPADEPLRQAEGAALSDVADQQDLEWAPVHFPAIDTRPQPSAVRGGRGRTNSRSTVNAACRRSHGVRTSSAPPGRAPDRRLREAPDDLDGCAASMRSVSTAMGSWRWLSKSGCMYACSISRFQSRK